MKKAIEIEENVSGAIENSYRLKCLTKQYRRMWDAFLHFIGTTPGDTVLEVEASSRSFIRSLQGASSWRGVDNHLPVTTSYQSYPIDLPVRKDSVERIEGDRSYGDSPGARRLPFADRQFDWVYCNAVIEHAGNVEKQYELLRELNRVARKGVFVTAGNRWYPIEFNTGVPFLHWLPLGMWRRVLKLIGKREWASEAVLNPLGSKNLMELARLLPGKLNSDVGHKRLFGIKAHFFLMIEKTHKQ